MKATCPHCGTYGTLEAFLVDADAKAAVTAVGKLPGDMPRLCWAYLGLFRKPGSARVLTWERVGRIVAELAELVAEPEMSWKGQRVVPSRPEHWAQGVQAMLDRDAAGKLERPLDGHNYLRAVVYEIAEKAWHQDNVRRETAAKHRDAPRRHCEGHPRSNPENARIATGRSVPRNDGVEYHAIPAAQALQGWRERLCVATQEDQHAE
jgi:hypothetical protein